MIVRPAVVSRRGVRATLSPYRWLEYSTESKVKHGTWLNGVRIGQPTHVQAGNTIQVGDTSLQLVQAGE